MQHQTSAHFAGSRTFANLQVSISDVPPIVQRCRVLSRPHASYSCRARVPRDVGKAMVLREHDGAEQVGTFIIDVGDCMDNQLD